MVDGPEGRPSRGGAGRHGGPGPHRGPRRGRGARRGAIRAAILLLLDEQARNGYQLMQDLEERSGGVWRPSPGSVYPALSLLEDEGLVEAIEQDGRKAFALTDDGRAHVEERREQFGTPWAAGDNVPGELHELRQAVHSLKAAVMQVAQTGSTGQLTDARKIVEDARRALYRLLADEPQTPDTK